MANNGLLQGTKRVDVFTGSTVTEGGIQVSEANPFPIIEISGLVPGKWDYVEITSRDGDLNPTEIVYRIGGSGGTIVATLTLTYDGNGDFVSASTA